MKVQIVGGFGYSYLLNLGIIYTRDFISCKILVQLYFLHYSWQKDTGNCSFLMHIWIPDPGAAMPLTMHYTGSPVLSSAGIRSGYTLRGSPVFYAANSVAFMRLRISNLLSAGAFISGAGTFRGGLNNSGNTVSLSLWSVQP